MASLQAILDDFALLDDWEDRYRYLIELGRGLEPFPEASRTDANRVRGCASQVWLDRRVEPGADGPRLRWLGDSDAHIVRGLIALVLALYAGRTPAEVLATPARPVFDEVGLGEHLTPQRSNGLAAMVERIRADARAAAEGAAAPEPAPAP